MEPSMKVLQLKPHKTTHTRSDTVQLTSALIASWKAPPFQRPLRVNEHVRALVETIKRDEGVVPGVVTLGVLGRDTYLLDGQHRIHAFTMTELPIGYADVRIHYFDDVGEMGEEFVKLNSRLVSFKPDDILRGLEEGTPALRYIRGRCAFVGYDMIRRGERSPIMSMSTLLRCWFAAAPETPANGGNSAINLARELTQEGAEELTTALLAHEKAWGRGPENARLWGTLNLTICLWLWRHTVTAQYSAGTPKISRDNFIKCLMSLSADSAYVDWLLGRHLSERDRSPAYAKLKTIFAKRLALETGNKIRLPSPPWAKSH